VDLETFVRIVAHDLQTPSRIGSALDVVTRPAAAPRLV
jgi:hypothetical protein